MTDLVAISIIDRLVQLLTIRERNREKYFNTVIEPLYRDAEVVARDYMALFAELVQRLQTAATPRELIFWLEQRRAAYQPVRMKIRVLLLDETFQDLSKTKPTSSRTRFAKGLWGLLKGTFLLGQVADEGRHAYLGEYGYGDHPILYFLQAMRSFDSSRDLDERRESLLVRARQQQSAIESAWTDAVGAYAELKKNSL